METITLSQAEKMYKKEIADNTINTEPTPHYNSLNQYCKMLEDGGYTIKK